MQLRRSRVPIAALVVCAAVAASGVVSTAALAAKPKEAKRDNFAFFDSRQSTASQKVLRGRAAKLDAEPSAAVDALRASLGNEGVVSIDPLTSTARVVARTDDFLTGSSSASAASVALGYVSANPAAVGLKSGDLGSLRLARDYVDIGGTHHLSWVPSSAGIPLFGNGLQANVTKDGRLINVLGSPVSSLSAPSTSPGINAEQAISAAKAELEVAIVPADSARPAVRRRRRRSPTVPPRHWSCSRRRRYPARLADDGQRRAGLVRARDRRTDWSRALPAQPRQLREPRPRVGLGVLSERPWAVRGGYAA